MKTGLWTVNRMATIRSLVGPRCSGRVAGRPCVRRATVRIAGRDYCGFHAKT